MTVKHQTVVSKIKVMHQTVGNKITVMHQRPVRHTRVIEVVHQRAGNAT